MKKALKAGLRLVWRALGEDECDGPQALPEDADEERIDEDEDSGFGSVGEAVSKAPGNAHLLRGCALLVFYMAALTEGLRSLANYTKNCLSDGDARDTMYAALGRHFMTPSFGRAPKKPKRCRLQVLEEIIGMTGIQMPKPKMRSQSQVMSDYGQRLYAKIRVYICNNLSLPVYEMMKDTGMSDCEHCCAAMIMAVSTGTLPWHSKFLGFLVNRSILYQGFMRAWGWSMHHLTVSSWHIFGEFMVSYTKYMKGEVAMVRQIHQEMLPHHWQYADYRDAMALSEESVYEVDPHTGLRKLNVEEMALAFMVESVLDSGSVLLHSQSRPSLPPKVQPIFYAYVANMKVTVEDMWEGYLRCVMDRVLLKSDEGVIGHFEMLRPGEFEKFTDALSDSGTISPDRSIQPICKGEDLIGAVKMFDHQLGHIKNPPALVVAVPPQSVYSGVTDYLFWTVTPQEVLILIIS